MSEFKLKSFTFQHVNPKTFVQSQWRFVNPKAYTAYRLTLAIALIFWIIFDIIIEWLRSYQGRPYCWLLFATNWSFLILVFATLLLALACVMNNCDDIRRTDVYGYKIYWFLYNMAANTVMTTSIIFLFALMNTNQSIFKTTQSKLKHILNGLVIIIDLFLSSITIRLFHGVYPLILGILYTIFLVVYYVAGGLGTQSLPYIYRALYWKYPASATVAVVCIVIVSILVQLVLFMLVQARVYLARALYGNDDSDYNTTHGGIGQDDLAAGHHYKESDEIPIMNQDHNTYSAIE